HLPKEPIIRHNSAQRSSRRQSYFGSVLIGKAVRNETNRWYCVAGGWCLPVRVGLFHEADFPFRIHFCRFGNCVTSRRRGGAFQQRSVLVQIRTLPPPRPSGNSELLTPSRRQRAKTSRCKKVISSTLSHFLPRR